MKQLAAIFIIAVMFFSVNSCKDNSSDPNSLGGSTEIELTEVGSEYGIYFDFPGDDKGVFNNVKDSVEVTKRENGVVTIKCIFTLDEESLKAVDTLLGTQDLSEDAKRAIVDGYLERFNATVDSTDKQNIKLETDITGKITNEGIQDYVYSKGDVSKPFTLIKYNAKVGDKYHFTDDAGKKYTREVVSKSNDDDYELGFIYIKVFKIEETQPEDPMIEKITYYANHKFGLVGIEMKMISGIEPSIKIFPWDVLN